MAVLIYLGGDSYPTEVDFETRFTQRISKELGVQVVSQTTMFCGEELQTGGGRSLPERLSRLDALVGLFNEPVILVGRSSGARVAAKYASENPVAGVICLAYPFQPQGGEAEPDRYAHLADIKTPTLIMQGVRDRYGGPELVDKYSFSAHVDVVMVDADHEFGLSDNVFEVVFESAKDFIISQSSR